MVAMMNNIKAYFTSSSCLLDEDILRTERPPRTHPVTKCARRWYWPDSFNYCLRIHLLKVQAIKQFVNLINIPPTSYVHRGAINFKLFKELQSKAGTKLRAAIF